MDIKAKYTGEREGYRHFYQDVPARDLTHEEYAALSDEQRRLVDSGVLYEVAPDPAPEEGS
ncbi:MAG: hypothetical protein C4551_10085 [Bacillota bacterium]|nr:MAG: hypothetical protein C4551_10085 [Bacillota bacterium]